MKKIILDTETTGLEPKLGHRIIELAAIELNGRQLSTRQFHYYLNPEREIDAGASAVHGLTYERLQNEPKFSDIVTSFLEFIKDSELIIHNAPFDLGFLNSELARLNYPPLSNPIIDTLKLAREAHPGKKNNLNALCSRYDIDNAHRTLHGALLDTELLGEVYLAMTRGQNNLLDEIDVSELPLAALLSTNTPLKKLRVLVANETELAHHAQQLADINKASKGGCIWEKLNSESVAG